MANIELVYHRVPDRVDHFQQEVLYDSEQRLITRHELVLKQPLIIEDQIVIDTGYTALWCISMEKPYDIGCIYDREGIFTGYYCDVMLPASRDGGRVHITDLCLDLWVSPENRGTILDEDEFEEACQNGWIAPAVAQEANRSLQELVKLVETQTFPPDRLGQMTRHPSGEYRTLKGAQHVARAWHRGRCSVI